VNGHGRVWGMLVYDEDTKDTKEHEAPPHPNE
jgi:hypothetical protein